MKKPGKNAGNILFIYLIFKKCRKDSILLIYGVIAYFLSGFLSGIFFHDNVKYYLIYAFSVNFIPAIFLYFAETFTRDKSKFKLTIIALFWGLTAYIGTIIGEYFKLIIDMMPMMLSKSYLLNDSFMCAKIDIDTLLKQYTGFSGLIGEALYKFTYINHENSHRLLDLGSYAIYASTYLESSRIFTIIAGVILVSDYFLSAKKYVNFISKNKSLNREKNNDIYYTNGLISTELPITIRPNALLYLLPALTLILCSIYIVFFTEFQYNMRNIYFIIEINISIYFIILVILEFNKVRFNLEVMSWHDNLDIKNTKLHYNNITSIDLEVNIITKLNKQIIIYSKHSQKAHRISTKCLDNYKISKIVRIISEKAPNAKLSNAAETLRQEKIIIKEMQTNWLINSIVYLFGVNIIITIILML